MVAFEHGINPLAGWIITAIGVLVIGVAKSGFGGGLGIVGVVLFALAFGAQKGNAILLPILIVSDVFSVYYHWGTWNKQVLKVMAPGTLVGILAGSLILLTLVTPPGDPARHLAPGPASRASATAAAVKTAREKSIKALDLITGLLSILYVLLDQVRRRHPDGYRRRHWKATHKTGFAAGSAAGVVSTLANAAGPISAIFLLGLGLPRAEFIGTTVLYFLALNTIKLIPYTLIPGLINWHSLGVGLYFLPLVPIGTGLGKWLSHRMSDRIFRNIMLGIVLITGVQLSLEATTGYTLVQILLGR